MKKPLPLPEENSDEALGLFLLGWLAGKCRSDECPIWVDVEASSFAHISGSDRGNIVNWLHDENGYDTHFEVVTKSGVRFRIEMEVIP